ncbi:radical SAM/SPASM domain-containing protein [Ruminococcus albus]|uniref:radical SAM/SPASM domain-containing protein n=1 Tax=Ruminococcus albus TaxID=1264 RepID=UPI000464FEBF|nr:radical SAM/SPASM domain-containing protein [Ruminococcus albus]
MSAFNIWITEKCNLCCSYCYEGIKRNIAMDDEVIEKTISFIQEHMERGKSNMINFHGGEPLLALDGIEKIMVKCGKFGRFGYSLTTNGTVMNDRVIDVLKKNNVYVSLSIDGTEKVHDINRKKHDGTGSYVYAIGALEALMEEKIDVRIRMTVTPDTVERLYESVTSIASMNVKTIVGMIDLYDNRWTDELFDTLQEQLIMIYTALDENDTTEFSFYSDIKQKLKKGLCDGGVTNFNIAADGNIYPCSCMVNDAEHIIGSVFSGIDNILLDKYMVYYDRRNTTCDGCRNEYTCLSMRCKYTNKSLTGDYLTASPMICKLEHIMHGIRVKNNA